MMKHDRTIQHYGNFPIKPQLHKINKGNTKRERNKETKKQRKIERKKETNKQTNKQRTRERTKKKLGKRRWWKERTWIKRKIWKERTWRKRKMGRKTVRHIDRKEGKRKIIKIPFENEIFPLTINNRSLPEKII